MSLANGETGKNEKKAHWLQLSWKVRFTIAVTGSVIAWLGIYWFNGAPFPTVSSSGGTVLRVAALYLCSVMCIMFPLWALLLLTQVLGRIRGWGNILSSVILLSFTVLIMNALLKDWFGSRHGGSFRWLILIAIIAAVLLYPLPIMRMKRKAVRLTTQGDYEGALQISRRWLHSKPYGRSFQGWIMLQAGQYSEALELLRDSAFDLKGGPQLTSLHLYNYVLTLLSMENYSEAQPLLEAAVLVPQKMGEYLQFTLVECLLSQNIDVNRALELIEQLIAKLKTKTPSAQDSHFRVLCTALHGWALASCKYSDEAKASLQEVFAQSESMGNDDLAGLRNLEGMTWMQLGDRGMARAAFEQALVLFPHGGIEMFARRSLARLSEPELNVG